MSASDRAPAVTANATAPPALCVSIHDVAPATWDACRRPHDAVRAVADIPLTWLVVPCYRGRRVRSPAMEAYLQDALGAGHELALHGFTHRDDAPAPPTRAWLARWSRSVYARGEGEFAALDATRTQWRIALGRAWFRARGWPLAGFVAPAWLLGPGALRALRQAPADALAPPFLYTTTWHARKTCCALHFQPAMLAIARTTALLG